MFEKVDRLSLLIFVSKGQKLPKIMSRWSGCDPKVYTKREQIEIIQRSICDIVRVYPEIAPQFMWEYFFGMQRSYMRVEGKKISDEDKELNILTSALYSIKITKFSEEDREIMRELRKEYIEPVEKESD